MDGFGDYPGYTHGDGCPCPMCKPLPRVAYGFEVTESRLIDDDTVLVIDKAALTSARLVEPKWEPPPDYRTALMQERIYLGLDFGRTEPEWRMLQRRAGLVGVRGRGGALLVRPRVPLCAHANVG
jgi:hypothetical protein